MPQNPVQLVKRLGKKEGAEKTIWTVDEFLEFIEEIQTKPEYYYAYEVMFWCGLRLGETLGMTAGCVDCDNNVIYVEKAFKNNKLGSTKTASSVRAISIPEELSEELREYMASIYGLTRTTRLFTMSKSSLHNIKDRACEKLGIQRLTLHELRHSHISLLVNSVSCASIKDVAKRAGHKNPTMTLNTYTHSYKDKEVAIANELNSMMRGKKDVAKD